LTEDGNVEITGRDLREGSALARQRSERGDTVLPGGRLRDIALRVSRLQSGGHRLPAIMLRISRDQRS
jgi:hypothetical protein